MFSFIQNLDYKEDMKVGRGILGTKETVRLVNETRTNEWGTDIRDIHLTHD